MMNSLYSLFLSDLKYRVVKNPCNTVLELRAQYIPYLESSEVRAFHMRKVLSSVQPSGEGTELCAAVWELSI